MNSKNNVEHFEVKPGQDYECSLCGRRFHSPTPFILVRHFGEAHNYKIRIVSLIPLKIKATPPKGEGELATTDALKKLALRQTIVGEINNA